METLLQEVITEKKQTHLSQKLNVTGAEAVVLSLLAEGVECVFGYPGGAIMPVYDAFYDYQDKLKHYLVRHEQGAIHAAQGYARVQGRAGVAIATSGPGATNLITGIADAMIDSTPIVCITGQVAKHLLGTDAFQEVDVISVSLPITKWNFQITRASEIPAIMAKAFYIAQSGRPGPVLIDITKNAQNERFDFEYQKCTKIRSYFPRRKVDMNAIEAAAELINNAKKPFLFVGQGVTLSKAEEVLKTFAEKSGIPVASTLLGLSAFSTKHPLYVGYLGMHGNYGPNIKTNECDVLIAVGMRFDDRVTGDLNKYAKQAKVIHIEIDPAEIDKNVKATVAIVSDAKEALIALTEAITPKSYPEWLQEFADADRIEYEKVISKDFAPSTEKIKMAEVIKMLSDKTEGTSIIATDVGQHQMTTTRYYQFTEKDSNITSGGAGTMGFCLPAAIGAKVGRPDRQVVAIIGDGGFQMTMQELGVIMQYKIAVKVIILNNNFLGMVRQWQQMFFDNRYSSVDMHNPNFIKLAEAFDIKAQKVEKREDLSNALDAMLDSPEAYFLEICVEKETNVLI